MMGSNRVCSHGLSTVVENNLYQGFLHIPLILFLLESAGICILHYLSATQVYVAN